MIKKILFVVFILFLLTSLTYGVYKVKKSQYIDPAWLGYGPIYKEKNITKPIYETKTTEVCEDRVISNETKEIKEVCYNETERVKVGETTKTIKTDERIGFQIGDTRILDKKVAFNGEMLSRWSIPIGDRNFEEYGACRDYEVQKGVCEKEKVDVKDYE